MSALHRPALLACSAARKPVASPLGIGFGFQAARMFQSRQPQLLKPFALRSHAFFSSTSSSSSSSSPSTSSNSSNNRDRSRNGSTSSDARFPRLRYLAASVPLVMVANEAPATSAQVPPPNRNNHGLPLDAEMVSEMSKGSILGTYHSRKHLGYERGNWPWDKC